MKQRWLILVAALLAELALLSPVAAQDATPRPGDGAGAVGPCTTAPRPVDEILAVFFDETGALRATPLPAIPESLAEADLPAGSAPDEQTVAAIDAVVRQFIACANIGLIPQEFALLTDNYLSQFGPGGPVEVPDIRLALESMAAGTPPAETGAAAEIIVTAPRGARLLADDRVAAIWGIEGDEAFLVFQRQADGRWLIDAVADLIDAAPAATPVP